MLGNPKITEANRTETKEITFRLRTQRTSDAAYLEPSGMAGVPNVTKDNITPPLKLQGFVYQTTPCQLDSQAGKAQANEFILVNKTASELEKWNTVYVHTLTLLRERGIVSVVHRAWDDPSGTREHIQKLKANLILTTPVVFDTESLTIRANTHLGFMEQNSMPHHIIGVISLLVGNGSKRGIFVDAYNKWAEIQTTTNTLCSTKASSVLNKAVSQHAKHALSRYGIILLGSHAPYICTTRAAAILSWITNIMTRVQSIWDKQERADLESMVAQALSDRKGDSKNDLYSDAGLPVVEKVSILPKESSPSNGQKLGSLNEGQKGQQCADEIEARKCMILASYTSAVTFLESNGVKHLMTRLFRGPIVVAQQNTVQKLLQNVCLFDYSNGEIVDATYPKSSTKILIAPNTVPAHIWFLVSLLTGTYPTTTAFESVIRKWKEIVEYVTTKSVDDPVVASDLLFDPVQDHALNAKNKYGDLILLNPRVYLDDLRLKCIENWMQELMLRVRKHMQNAVLISDAKETMMHRANEEGNFTKVEEMSAMRNAGEVHMC